MTHVDKEMRELMAVAESTAAMVYDRYPPRTPSQRPPGYARGIDFYIKKDLVRVIAAIFRAYMGKAGTYPDLLKPERYSEKLNALKLLGWMRIPETGNKLLTGKFLVPGAAPLLHIPEVVWASTKASLPQNGKIPDGEYYFKANYGSGFCRRIRYPLMTAERVELEWVGQRWLNGAFGLNFGEWWYNVFEKAIFLERSVTQRNPSAVMLFYMFRERVGLISVDEKFLDGTGRTRESLFDRSFHLIPKQIVGSEPVVNFSVPEHMKEQALKAAEAIRRSFEAVRVDIIPGDDGKLYLNEITFCSEAGMPLQNVERDIEMGQMWGPCSFL